MNSYVIIGRVGINIFKFIVIIFSDSGSVLTWGWNEHGICGTRDETVNMHQPEAVAKLHDYHISVIGCGGGHSFAFAKR